MKCNIQIKLEKERCNITWPNWLWEVQIKLKSIFGPDGSSMLWSEYRPKTAPLGCTAESRKDQSGNKSKTWHLVDFAALYAIFATSYTYHSGIYIVGVKKMSCLEHCSWMVILPLLSPSVLISSPFSSAEWAFQHQEKLFHLIKIWIAQTESLVFVR